MKNKEKFITPAGFKKLKQQLKEWEKKLAKITAIKGYAAEFGGDKWHDNFSFEEIERLQKVYGARITELRQQLRENIVLTETQLKKNAQKNKINIGSKLKIRYRNNRTKIIKIVGSGESEPDRELIAYDTPLGKALLNKKPGQKTTFLSNNKKTDIEIVVL